MPKMVEIGYESTFDRNVVETHIFNQNDRNSNWLISDFRPRLPKCHYVDLCVTLKMYLLPQRTAMGS